MVTSQLDRTAVVLLHGQPGDVSDWAAVLSALPEDVDVLVLDRPGYGTNPLPPATIDGNARWLIRELDKSGIRDAIVVGHSYGGGVALAAAALAPDRIRGLVLVSSIGPGCLKWWDYVLAAPVVGPLASIAMCAMLPGAPWRSFLAEQRELVRHLSRLVARLDEISAPTLIIADPADGVVPVATAHQLNERLTDSRLELVAEGGHSLPKTISDTIAALITAHVAAVGARL
jgi:pimeloyl-ACP methyl ester carboxylesterase